ncbi:MFS transporter [Cohnella sp. GCM10027633]|uniref:MFS transporter n=1 Tax=unclassified Cohnella TaxID=2636738 RepID=UPI0036332075
MPEDDRATRTNERADSIREYIASPEKLDKLRRRTLAIVVLSQLFGGAGLAAGITVGALLAQEMLGTDSYAGVPTALFTLGAAAAALTVGRLSQRRGRRVGLAAGFLSGSVGAAGIVLAAVLDNVPLLFVALLVYGGGNATNLLARYAGADLAKPSERARAISTIMVATTFGAVAGPNLVDVTGQFAASIGVPELASPFLLGGAAYLLAGIVLLLFLRPDPLRVAQALAEAQGASAPSTAQPDSGIDKPSRNNRGLAVGATVMLLTQIVMVAIMTMTPVHMKHHGHGLGDVGLVISLHVCAMFLPSLVTGMLVDKLGRKTMSYASGVTLLAAGVLAATAPADSMPLLIVALVLLGLGWNFGLISGTAQIVDATTVETRAKTQGTIDVLVSLSGATGGALSGVVAAHSSYAALSLGGGLLSLLLIPVVVWSRGQPRSNC